MSRFLELIKRKVVIYDGANGTQVQSLGLSPRDFGGKPGCIDYLSLTRPDVPRAIHESYLAAGADVITTNTFGSTRPKLAEYGLESKLDEINRAAARIAREAADKFARLDGSPRFVAGDLGPTGFLPSSDDPVLGAVGFDRIKAYYVEQAIPLIESGVDLMLIETTQDIIEARATIAGIREAYAITGVELPIQAQVTLDERGRMLLGGDISAAMVPLEAAGVDVIGLNCSTGPEQMADSIRFLAERCTAAISCVPNAGLPINVGGQAVYPLSPGEFAAILAGYVRDLGIEVVGGCCGTTPEHIRRLAEAVGRTTRKARGVTRWSAVSSSMKGVSLRQEPRPLIVGERLNAQGSRRAKKMLLADDIDGLINIAREQVAAGAGVLDVSMAAGERDDEPDVMRKMAKRLAMSVEAPMMIDSTDPAAIEAALKAYPGRAIVNSINMERGLERINAVMPLVRTHRAVVVALTIDEAGMARTVERKVEVARRIYEVATRDWGMRPDDIVFDPLTFTLATGEEGYRDCAHQTLLAISEVKKELPGVLTILGVSNVSFGLNPAARRVLNSIFLYRAVEAGLDLAIVNAAEITPYPAIPHNERDLCEDLLYNRRPDALERFIGHFEGKSAEPAAAASTAAMTPVERIRHQIINRTGDNIEEQIDALLQERPALEILNGVLLPAMAEVGERFGSGELILPFVLQSAEVMKRAVAHLERFLEKKEATKGKVVLATVLGDVHDIGKNLVNTILSNNGYTVIDLGKQVPAATIVAEAVRLGADAIGLSALLVSTSRQMPIVVEELRRRSLAIPVLIGGAAIHRDFGYRALYAGGDGPEGPVPYPGGVYYCRDAFEGLSVMDRISRPASRAAFVQGVLAAAAAAIRRMKTAEAAPAEPVAAEAPSPRVRRVAIPAPPFFGARTDKEIDPAELFGRLSINELYRLSWGAKGKRGVAFETITHDVFEPKLRELEAECIRDGILKPAAVWGYFRCRAEGNRILVFDPADESRVAHTFAFPRQPHGERLCIADYVSDAEDDVIAMQVVTVGRQVSETCARLNDAGEPLKAYYLHGLAVQTAEALATHVHCLIRAEWGIPPGRGKRYSPGYPSWPDVADHAGMFDLLGARQAIGVELTSAYQIIPEQSTAACVIHHPDAKYFNII